MKARESGMPDEEYWSTFFDPECMLNELGCIGAIDVLEFGCGYGNFTTAAARLISGTVFTNDIDRSMVKRTVHHAREQGLQNISAEVRDFSISGSGRPGDSIDFVMLFNILHIENPSNLLREAYRVLKPTGKLGVIHWKWEKTTPRGPSMEIRPKAEQCRFWAEEVGFGFERFVEFACCSWHWGMVLGKQPNKECNSNAAS